MTTARADADRLRDEAELFAPRSACEDCVHFDAVRERCAHGYPTDAHRAARIAEGSFVFCKEFELA